MTLTGTLDVSHGAKNYVTAKKIMQVSSAGSDSDLAALRLEELQDLGILGSGSSGVARKVPAPAHRSLALPEGATVDNQ